MIRDYLRRPNRYGSGRYENNDPIQERGRQQGASHRDVDWDRWPDAEALRWSPRSGPRDDDFNAIRSETRRHEEGYGYAGDPYFADEERVSRPRFQEGWEGSYRSTPWTLGAEQVSPGMHGPYGQQYQGGQDERYGGGQRYASSYGFGDDQGRYRRPWADDQGQHGPHRGLGPQGYTRTDDRIREEVCERLTDHPSVDPRNVEVTVENGVVLLQGMVTDRSMKYCAEDCAGRVSGVKDVDNRIRVDRAQHSQLGAEGSDPASYRKP